MAIETPVESVEGEIVESVEGEILKTDSTRPSVPPSHPRVANRDNLRRGVPIGTIDVEYYLYSQRVENARVALMSDNTSAVAYLRNQGGTKSLAMNDLATDIYVCGPRRGE